MANPTAFRIKPPADDSVFYDTFGGILDVLGGLDEKVNNIDGHLHDDLQAIHTQLVQIAEKSGGEHDVLLQRVLIFLIEGVAQDQENGFSIRGDHPWVAMLQKIQLPTLAAIAKVPGSVTDVAEDIEDFLQNAFGQQLPDDAPTADELKQLVEIARLVTAQPQTGGVQYSLSAQRQPDSVQPADSKKQKPPRKAKAKGKRGKRRK